MQVRQNRPNISLGGFFAAKGMRLYGSYYNVNALIPGRKVARGCNSRHQ